MALNVGFPSTPMVQPGLARVTTSILDLPLELQYAIFKQLPMEDLQDVAVCCRSFTPVAQQLIIQNTENFLSLDTLRTFLNPLRKLPQPPSTLLEQYSAVLPYVENLQVVLPWSLYGENYFPSVREERCAVMNWLKTKTNLRQLEIVIRPLDRHDIVWLPQDDVEGTTKEEINPQFGAVHPLRVASGATFDWANLRATYRKLVLFSWVDKSRSGVKANGDKLVKRLRRFSKLRYQQFGTGAPFHDIQVWLPGFFNMINYDLYLRAPSDGAKCWVEALLYEGHGLNSLTFKVFPFNGFKCWTEFPPMYDYDGCCYELQDHIDWLCATRRYRKIKSL